MHRDDYFARPRPQIRPFVPAGARTILDVGCGEGAFASGLREERRSAGRELEIWGLELDPKAAATAASVLDRVMVGSAEDLVAQLPDDRFDCITCNDVLEHLVWPDRLLRDLRRTLRPGGVVVASIPNVRYFANVWALAVRGTWTYTDKGILDRTHLRFYTRSSMRELFASAGYRILRQEGINPSPDRRLRLLNLVTGGQFDDLRFVQFVCVAGLEDPTAS